jgi:valyl-tRNA synthetase
MSEIPKAYEPQAVEAKWYQFWLEQRCFVAEPARVGAQRPPYAIVIPPPNVTGVLTMGHVLNNTLQDILARKARMDGKEVLWLPGTDHAGIATQTVVERSLKQAGEIKHRNDLGREAFLERVWQWKEKHGGIIIQQLQKLGASCDWTRERFTMDPEYSRCVQRVFLDLYQKGLIYRGKRMVNWCPVSLTALSDEEVVMKEQRGLLYYFKVEVAEAPGTWLTIATTRPETIPADTAVAVNPKDPRYAALIGQHVRRALPLEDQALIPIIGDEQIDVEFGTGVLKVTPAHDPADFAIGLRHHLPVIDILNPDGTMNELAGRDLAGLDRAVARRKAAELLSAHGTLEKQEPYVNNVGFSERADVPVEPRLSEQWFLRYPSVGPARACVVSPGMKGSAPAPGAWADAASAHGREGRGSDEGEPSAGARSAAPGAGAVPIEQEAGAVPIEQEAGAVPIEQEAGAVPIEQEVGAVPIEQEAGGESRDRMRFFPDRWAKVYDHWMEGLQDWCISRQLWWGHRIPVWTKRSETSLRGLYAELLTVLIENTGFAGGDTRGVAIRVDDQPVAADPSELRRLVESGDPRLDAVAMHQTVICTICDQLPANLARSGFAQDPDVLDTWFSSWLWPFATMGWTGDPAPDARNATLQAFYPTTDLVTGPDIIFFWVARMIMAGYEYLGKLPFRNVYFTGIIRDKHGHKMSKSLGNSPDPLALIAGYGADAVRFGIIRSVPLGQDLIFEDKEFDRFKKEERYDFARLPWNPARFPQLELARNFCNKLWNACRFRQLQGGITEGEIERAWLTSDDHWILLRLDQAIRELDEAFANYRFAEATSTLYRFFWSEYCDWYIEASKAALRPVDEGKPAEGSGGVSPAESAADGAGAAALRANKLAVIDFVLGHTLRLFHPFLPFITEELWQGMGYAQDLPPDQGGRTILFAHWPRPLDDAFRAHYGLDEAAARLASAKYELVGLGRNLRREFNLPAAKRLRLVLRPAGELAPGEVEVIRLLLNAEAVEVDRAYQPAKGTPRVANDLGELFLPLEGVIDVVAERTRLTRERDKARAEVAKVQEKLGNPNFTQKVPPAVLEEHRRRLTEWEGKLNQAEASLANLPVV